MRKILLSIAIAMAIVSCNNGANKNETVEKPTPKKENEHKTAYIDTEKLLKEYNESKEFESKFKSMSERMQKELDNDFKKFQKDVLELQKNAQFNGMEWAQKREAELAKRQQTLQQKEQNYLKKFQEESAVERDSMISRIKTFIKDYGKENGYDYIYGTGDVSTVLYAKDKYDITDVVIKLLNEKYQSKTQK